MSVTPEVKKELISRFKIHDNDTGSPEVQIALLTQRIQSLTDHFKQHVKDHSSRHGLIKLVNQRRRLLRVLKGANLQSYKSLVEKLDLRG